MRTDARDLLAVGILGSGSQIGERIEMLLLRGGRFTETVSLTGVTAGAFALLCIMLAGSMAPRWIAFAQTKGPRPAFEVVSVKPLDRATMSRDHEGSRLDGGLFVDRTDLFQYIVHAYLKGGACVVKAALGEDCPQIAGALPAWLKADRWEIEARLPPGSPVYTPRQLQSRDTPQLNLMLQVLLEDRFHLRVHTETREIPVYVLHVGRNGPKLKRTPDKGELVRTADGTLVEHHGLNGFQSISGPDGAPRTGLSFQASSMSDAAEALGRYFDRPVLDRTGLGGEYDFVIEYDVDRDEQGPIAAPNFSGRGGNFINPYTGLSSAALSAVVQGLGLRLESTKAPVEILVIDHVEKPDAN